MDQGRVRRLVSGALHDADDGELFLEYVQSEQLAFDDNVLKSASFNTSQGFGLRSVIGEASAYAHASELSEEAIKRAAKTTQGVFNNQQSVTAKIEPAFGT